MMPLSLDQQSALTRTIIEESGGDTSKVSNSYAAADRSGHKVNEEIATHIPKKKHGLDQTLLQCIGIQRLW